MKRSAFMAPLLVVGLVGCGGVTTYEGSFVVLKAPADDEALRKWVEEQPGVRDVSVTRDGKTIHVRYTRDEARWEFRTPPFKDLGYEASPGHSWKGSRTNRLVPWVPDWVVVILAIVAVTTIIEVIR